MKAVVAAFNQEKALVGAFSVIVKTDCETMDRLKHSSYITILPPSRKARRRGGAGAGHRQRHRFRLGRQQEEGGDTEAEAVTTSPAPAPALATPTLLAGAGAARTELTSYGQESRVITSIL